jgi:flagellar motility protein MotE (MotC chaperone)
MAEERTPNTPQENAEPSQPIVRKKKKKKKLGKLTFLFWLLLLALGTATGMHLSGIWDGRPLFWSVVPKIPFVGSQLAEFFQIPEVYALTSQERRAVELEQWQRRLDAWERSLESNDVSRMVVYEEREQALLELSRDVARRQRKLRAQEEAVTSQESSGPTETEQELMNQVARTYQDMSARNAAAVVEQLRDSLAVELLMRLPNDARASILGKIKPAKAARITELMANPRQR